MGNADGPPPRHDPRKLYGCCKLPLIGRSVDFYAYEVVTGFGTRSGWTAVRCR